MYICVKQKGNSEKIICSNILSGLTVAASDSSGEIIFFSDKLPEELHEIENFMNLAAMLKIAPDSVTVGTSHPSSDLIRNLKIFQIKNFMIATMEGNELRENGVFDVAAISESCCTKLYYRKGKNPTSVCGAHDGLLVLGAGHISKFCIENHSTCPHWRIRGGERNNV